jgi:CDP-diacylglycerol--glycerol-3-phosphate 3-phosphatidyltransferase
MSRARRVRWQGGVGLVAVVAVGAAALGGWSTVEMATSPAVADRWLLVAGSVVAFEVGYLAYHLDADRPGVAVAVPNLLTLCRGGLYAATAGFLVVPPTTPAVRWAPGVCYGVGVALDYLDGAVARRTDRETALGAKLDLAFDTLGFLVAPLVGVVWGRLPVWYLSLSAARYLYRVGVWAHERRGGAVAALPESRVRRPLAALQMAFITTALPPVVPVAVVYPASAVVLAPSLAVFLRDYLVVTGRLGAEG